MDKLMNECDRLKDVMGFFDRQTIATLMLVREIQGLRTDLRDGVTELTREIHFAAQTQPTVLNGGVKVEQTDVDANQGRSSHGGKSSRGGNGR